METVCADCTCCNNQLHRIIKPYQITVPSPKLATAVIAPGTIYIYFHTDPSAQWLSLVSTEGGVIALEVLEPAPLTRSAFALRPDLSSS
eukprot:COSAG01_NODE_17518_length_1144_cov_1.365550_2_plen_88_part_01